VGVKGTTDSSDNTGMKVLSEGEKYCTICLAVSTDTISNHVRQALHAYSLLACTDQIIAQVKKIDLAPLKLNLPSLYSLRI